MSRTKRTLSHASGARPELRRLVRDVLMALPDGRKAHAEAVLRLVNDLTPIPASQPQVSDALSWNLTEGYVSYIHNGELERDEWFITSEGRIKSLQS